MAKHNGIKPPAQARSLRAIAETNKGDYPDPAAVDKGGAYQDVAEAAQPTKNIGSVAGPTPFTNLRGGR